MSLMLLANYRVRHFMVINSIANPGNGWL